MDDHLEQEAHRRGYQIVAGVDEAGRGPLAGPVVAAACILPRGYQNSDINDSKKLTKAKRKRIYEQLYSDSAIHIGVGIVSPKEIDQINILQASLKAMILAVANLKVEPDFLLIDGNTLPRTRQPSAAIVKGDAKSLSIAAASIVAKEERDGIMRELAERYPNYALDKHMGYPTKAHMEAIRMHGPTPIHRMSFSPLNQYVEVNRGEPSGNK
ncbi:MAG: Ribonuclease HII [Chlamydiia bacterium]|nr:Ribonuclease HII [Chlamydiia bacterium]